MTKLILLVLTSAELGGAERTALEIIDSVGTEAYRFHVLLPRPGRLVEALAQRRVASTILPFGSHLSRAGRGRLASRWLLLRSAVEIVLYLFRYYRLVRRLAPDLVYTHGLKAELLTGLAAFSLKVPLIWHLHSFVPEASWLGRLHRLLQRWPRLLIANSKAVQAGVASPYQGRTRLLYCGVDAAVFSPKPHVAAAKALGIYDSRRPMIVGMISVLAPWKGIDLFLTAVAPLLKADPSWQAVVVGDALYDTAGHEHYGQTLATLAYRLGIALQVRFLPFMLDPAPAFAALDLFVHASKTPEPFGRVIAEAMSCGRAVIASDGGGAAEQITSGVDGLLTPLGDAAALREAMATLMSRPDQRKRLAAAARGTILRRGTLEAFAADLLPLLAEALRQPTACATPASDAPEEAA